MKDFTKPPERLASIGEASFFISQIGGADVALWLISDIEPRAPVWWHRQSAQDQIYFVQYLRVPAGMQYIVLPRWEKMKRPAQTQFMERLDRAVTRAMQTLADADSQRGVA